MIALKIRFQSHTLLTDWIFILFMLAWKLQPEQGLHISPIYVTWTLMTCRKCNDFLSDVMGQMLWTVICKIIPWAKVNFWCHMSIFIHVCCIQKCWHRAQFNQHMGTVICHMLSSIFVKCKFICNMWYIIIMLYVQFYMQRVVIQLCYIHFVM